MPALPPTDVRIAAGTARLGYISGELYLTDEVFLYRVIGLVERGGHELIELEDCYGLDVVEIPTWRLRRRRLRVVDR